MSGIYRASMLADPCHFFFTHPTVNTEVMAESDWEIDLHAAEKMIKAGIDADNDKGYDRARFYYANGVRKLKELKAKKPVPRQWTRHLDKLYADTTNRLNFVVTELLHGAPLTFEGDADVKDTSKLGRGQPPARPPKGFAYPRVDSIPIVKREVKGKPPEPSKTVFNLAERIINMADYSKVKRLGNGAFGYVVLAENKTTKQKVALKFLKEAIVAPEEQRAFFREVESMAHANHPAVLKFVGFNMAGSQDEPGPVIATEYLPNGNVEDIISRRRTVSPAQKMIILYGICEALAYLHGKRIVHRDLKPANVMLNADLEPVVGDFGLAKTMTQDRMRQTFMMGSPVYMAPELYRDDEFSDKVDVYAFGIMTFEILTDTLAFNDIQNPGTLRKKVLSGGRPELPASVPEIYKELLAKLWAAKDTDRPSFRHVAKWFKDGRLNLNGADLKVFQAYVKKLEAFKDE
jgi:hypothetical protein